MSKYQKPGKRPFEIKFRFLETISLIKLGLVRAKDWNYKMP